MAFAGSFFIGGLQEGKRLTAIYSSGSGGNHADEDERLFSRIL